jgi:hypothetical protein
VSELPDGVGTADADKATPMKTYVHKGAHPAHVTQPVPSVRQLSCLGGAAQPCAQIRSSCAEACVRPSVPCGGAGCQSGAAEAIAPLDDRTILRSITKFYGLADATLQESLVYRGASASPKKLYSVSHGARQVLLAAPIDAKRPLRCAPNLTAPRRPHANRLSSAGVCVQRVRVRVRAACACACACSVVALGLQAFERQEVRWQCTARGRRFGRAGVVVDGQRWSCIGRTSHCRVR